MVEILKYYLFVFKISLYTLIMNFFFKTYLFIMAIHIFGYIFLSIIGNDNLFIEDVITTLPVNADIIAVKPKSSGEITINYKGTDSNCKSILGLNYNITSTENINILICDRLPYYSFVTCNSVYQNCNLKLTPYVKYKYKCSSRKKNCSNSISILNKVNTVLTLK